MRSRPFLILLRYGSAAAGIALATWLRMLFDPFLHDHFPFGLCYVAVLFSAWYGGWGPALLAFVLGLLATNYFFIAPRDTFAFLAGEHLIGLAVYSFVGFAGIFFSESLRAARRRAEANALETLAKRKELEREIGERQRVEEQLRAREEQLADAGRRKDEFLALLGHELRNPLAPIRNALQIMRRPGMDAPVVEQMRAIMERQVQQLSRLVDDLLEVSRVARGKIQLRMEIVDFPTVIQQAVDASRAFFEVRHQEVTLVLPQQSLYLRADPARLQQIVMNLLDNASKYTPERGHIWITARRQADLVELEVRDNGIGISAELLLRMFEPFVQGERLAGQAQAGLGIGLHLVRSLVQMHSGTITAHSDGPGKGSRFIARFPALLERQDNTGSRVQNGEQQSVAPTPKHRILVVDDNQAAADSLALLLKLEGQEVRVAYEGPAALLAVQSYLPDVAVLDIGMPGMDGYELAQRLRRQPGLEQLLLVALTGWGQEADRRRSHDAGFDLHLVKPVDPAVLHDLLVHPETVKATRAGSLPVRRPA
jgi:signal transduction histidine kinase/CheY-like chemotaxis protein